MVRQDTVAIVGAGIVGATAAYCIAREGRTVLLLDRAAPGTGGASFGNAGHIATEQVFPLPSKQLLLGFWRELSAFGGPLDIPLRRLGALSPWLLRFAAAAFRQRANAAFLAPLVRAAVDSLADLLVEIGRRDLLVARGHQSVWFGSRAHTRAAQESARAAHWGVRTELSPAQTLLPVAAAAGERQIAGLWYPDTAHVVDPLAVVEAFVAAALHRGATFRLCEVRRLEAHEEGVHILTDRDRFSVRSAVVCAGVWSRSLLAPLGIHAPLEAERGYHVELPGHAALAPIPLVYADRSLIVTPMAARLRCSSFLEFAGLGAPPDPGKWRRLRSELHAVGYDCASEGGGWMGSRPTLPDYLPGIGRCPASAGLLYAVGHQHLGLTLAAPTAGLIADLVAQRSPRFDIAAFDLQRFGPPRHT